PHSLTMIPYHTLEESKDALGRNLTFAETVWFNYSAKKSDFVLHCHNTLFLCLFYSIAPIPFALIELSGCKKLNKYKIQPSVKRTFLEMFKCYKYVIKTFIIAVGPLQIVSYPFIKLEAIETHSGYEFPWSFTKYIPFYGGPTYHDYHHSVGGTSQGNFASVFTYCDYIYGTQKGYQYKKRIYENMSPSNTFNKVE
ncbi:Methylsterol monooxygenase 1-2, variant 2, partial [Lathyrus oleraceus]